MVPSEQRTLTVYTIASVPVFFVFFGGVNPLFLSLLYTFLFFFFFLPHLFLSNSFTFSMGIYVRLGVILGELMISYLAGLGV